MTKNNKKSDSNSKTDKKAQNTKPNEESKCKTSKLGCIFSIIEFKLKITDSLRPFVNLTIRVWMAWIFLKSGLLKLPKDFLDLTGLHSGIKQAYSWDSTVYLFSDVHPVPLLSPKVAAILGTGLELLAPIFLILGLGARPAAAILLIMTAVIELTSDPEFLSEAASLHHYFWMMLLSVIVFYGAGKFSIDHIIRKKSLACPKYRAMAKIEEK